LLRVSVRELNPGDRERGARLLVVTRVTRVPVTLPVVAAQLVIACNLDLG
jgi:hypothetical protein